MTVVEMLIVVGGRAPAAGAGVVPGTPGATAAGVMDEAPGATGATGAGVTDGEPCGMFVAS